MKCLFSISLFLFSTICFADGFVTSDKTYIDFNETNIDGAMKAPTGFFIQGRQSQSLKQMVRLRSKFRNELRNSKAAVKSAVK